MHPSVAGLGKMDRACNGIPMLNTLSTFFFFIWTEQTILSQIAQREMTLDYFKPPHYVDETVSQHLSYSIK